MTTEPKKCELVVEKGVRLDATLTIADVQDTFQIQEEDRLDHEQSKLKLQISQAEAAHAKLNKELEEEGEKVVATADLSGTGAMVTASAMTAWIGVAYTVLMELQKILTESKVVTYSVTVLSQDELNRRLATKAKGEKNSWSSSREDSYPSIKNPKPMTVDFSPRMIAIIDELTAAATTHRELKDQLQVLLQERIDLPKKARRQRAAFTRAMLKGDDISGPAVLQYFDSTNGQKALTSQ